MSARNRPRRVRWAKLTGLACIVGVAATGAVIARGERRRRAYSPDEIRSRLHERLDVARTRGAAEDQRRPRHGS